LNIKNAVAFAIFLDVILTRIQNLSAFCQSISSRMMQRTTKLWLEALKKQYWILLETQITFIYLNSY